jgi:phage baseplate assembly protein W
MSILDEQLLSLGPYGAGAVAVDLEGAAYKIQWLLLTEPGTYPTCPSMGIGIQSYMHDALTDDVTSEIQSLLEEQIRTYIPGLNVSQVLVEGLVGPEGVTNTLGVLVQVTQPGGQTKDMAIVFNPGGGGTTEVQPSIYF